MSNGTKRLGKDFHGPPKFPSVTVIYDGKGINVGYKNATWELAVSLLIDGLKAARIEETKAKQKKEASQIIVPTLAGIPPLKEN